MQVMALRMPAGLATVEALVMAGAMAGAEVFGAALVLATAGAVDTAGALDGGPLTLHGVRVTGRPLALHTAPPP